MINAVQNQLIYLKLKTAASYLRTLDLKNDISNAELSGLYRILEQEVIAKEENNKLYNVKVAGFPFLSLIDDYDFNFQPGLNEDKIRGIASSNF